MRPTAKGARKSNANGTWTENMRKPRLSASGFVVCIRNTGYGASLERHKIYRVVPDAAAAGECSLTGTLMGVPGIPGIPRGNFYRPPDEGEIDGINAR
jgi:hypothetical protein